MKKNPPILMLDDEPEVLKVFKLLLEKAGYKVYTAMTRKQALKILKMHPISVGLIDMKLVGENGIDVSREMKDIDELLKLIICTGYPSYETALKAMKIGAYDYVSKSTNHQDIIGKIEKALLAREKDIAKKVESCSNRHGFIMVCHHTMIMEAFENFCRENTDFGILHNFHSMDFIKPLPFNSNAELVLLCATCNQNHFARKKELLEQIKMSFPNARPALINCDFGDDEKKDCIKHGVKGFLSKNMEKEMLQKAFYSILGGELWADRKLVHDLLMELLQTSSPEPVPSTESSYRLSRRQVEILKALAAGLSNMEISEQLAISEKTVKVHIGHLFKKIGVKSRTQAVRKAMEARLL